MAALEYLSANSLITYPFKDGMIKLSSDDSYTIPNDFFLDMLIVAKKQTIKRAYLHSLAVFLSGSKQATAVIKLVDEEEVVLFTETVTGVITNKGLITGSSANCYIKIVYGVGAVDASVGLSKTFSLDTAEICSGAIILAPPRVKKITFFNSNAATGEPEAFVGNILDGTSAPIVVNLQEGTNTSFKQNKELTTTELGIIPRAGAGQYDGCRENGNEDTIVTLNGVKPDEFGNIKIGTDNCHNTRAAEYGLEFEHTCEPKCTTDQIAATAYYLNRIKDGLLVLTDRVKDTIEPAFESLVTEYQSILDDQDAPKPVTVTGKYWVTSTQTLNYFSLAIGINNPNNFILNNIVLTLAPGANLTYVAGTSKVNKKDVITNELGHAGIQSGDNVDIACQDSIVYLVVYSAPVDKDTAGPVEVTVSYVYDGDTIEVDETISLTVPPQIYTTTSTTSTSTTTTGTTSTSTTSTTSTSTTSTTTTSTTSTTTPPPNFAAGLLLNINFAASSSNEDAEDPNGGAVLEQASGNTAGYWNNTLGTGFVQELTGLKYNDNSASGVIATLTITPDLPAPPSNLVSISTVSLIVPPVAPEINNFYKNTLQAFHTTGAVDTRITLVLTNLSIGNYDVCVYAHGNAVTKNCAITLIYHDHVGNTDTTYGPYSTTSTDQAYLSPVWKDLMQLALYDSAHAPNKPEQAIADSRDKLTIVIDPGATSTYTALNAIQIKRKIS